jgi:hypothetical protein
MSLLAFRGRSMLGHALRCGLIAAALVSCGDDSASSSEPEPPPMHPAWRRTRLLLTDHDASRVEVVDVEYRSSVGIVDLPDTAASLALSGSGQHALVPQDGAAALLYAGIAILDHSAGAADSAEPHIHVYKFDPTLVDYPLLGPGRPFVSAVGGTFAVTFPNAKDTEPSALLFQEQSLQDDPPPDPMATEGLGALAGPVQPFHEGLLVHRPEAIVYLDDAPAETAVLDCSDVTAYHVRAERAVFACAGSVHAFAPADIPNGKAALVTSGLGAVRRVEVHPDLEKTLVLSEGGVFLAADGNAQELKLPAGVAACEATLEPGYARSVVVLGSDGQVYHLDVATGDLLAQRSVVAAFDCGASLTPHLAVAPSRTYVTDPEARSVVELWLDNELEELATLGLAVRPAGVSIAGVDFATRNLGDLDD